MKRLWLGALITGVAVWGYWVFAKSETPGERFRKAMQARAQYCSTHKIQANDTSCDILKLQPTDPMATPEGRYAHSIRLPESEPKDVYKRGMTSEEYFRALCDTQAGDFVFKTVENVSGILQVRSSQPPTDYMLSHLYAMEDPFAYVYGEMTGDPQDYYVQPFIGRFSFLEMPNPHAVSEDEAYLKFFRDTGPSKKQFQTALGRSFVFVPYVVGVVKVSDTRSQFGYAWRAITRTRDREFGIAGGELIVLDLRTQEVLGFRRGFVKTGKVKNVFTGVWWMTAGGCPQNAREVNGRLEKRPNHEFVYEVLRPHENSNAGFNGGR